MSIRNDIRAPIKSLGNLATEGGRYLVSEFITNKDFSRGIKDFDKYQMYQKQLDNPYITSDEYDAVQGQMINEGIIDPNLYGKYLKDTAANQALASQGTKDSQKEVEDFRVSLVDTVKDNYVAGDKYQREVLNKAIDKLTTQFQWTADNINTTYEEFKDEKLKQKWDELRPEYEQLIRDSAKKYGQYINQGLTYDQAYKKLIDEGIGQANRIVQIQNDLRRRQDRGAGVVGSFKQAGQAFGEGEVGKGLMKTVLGIFNGVSGVLNIAGEAVEEGKQALGGYDVLEELNNLNVYRDSGPVMSQRRTLKSYGYDILDALPQLAPSIASLFVGNKAGTAIKLEQFATNLLKVRKGAQLLDTAVDVSRGGKFLAESLQDFFLLDAVAQPLIGRPMTTDDFVINWMFNLPINGAVASLTKGLKLTDKIPQSLFTAMGMGKEEGAQLGKEYIEILKDVSSGKRTLDDGMNAVLGYQKMLAGAGTDSSKEFDPTKLLLLDEIAKPMIGKPTDIALTSLDQGLKDTHAQIMNGLLDINKRIAAGTSTREDIVKLRYQKDVTAAELLKRNNIINPDNFLIPFLDSAKAIQEMLPELPNLEKKLTQGATINLLKQGVLTKDDVIRASEELDIGRGRSIIEAMMPWSNDTDTVINHIKKYIGGDTETIEFANKELDDAYNQFTKNLINIMSEKQPNIGWSIGQYKNLGNGKFQNIITNEIKTKDEILRGGYRDMDIGQSENILSSLNDILKNPNASLVPGETSIYRLSNKILLGSDPTTLKKNNIWTFVLDPNNKGAKPVLHAALKPFGIKASLKDSTVSLTISKGGLERLQKTLTEIRDTGWNISNLPETHMDAYRLIFLKQYMVSMKTFMATAEDTAQYKTYFEHMYEPAIEGVHVPNTKFDINSEYTNTLQKYLTNSNYEGIEQTSAIIITHEAIRDTTKTAKEIAKVITVPLGNPKPITKAVEAVVNLSKSILEGKSIDKDLSEIIGKIVGDRQSNGYIGSLVDIEKQNTIYSITFSKMMGKSDTVKAYISDAQGQMMVFAKDAPPELRDILRHSELKVSVDLSLKDKITNIKNIGNVIKGKQMASLVTDIEKEIVRLKQTMKSYKHLSIIDITDNVNTTPVVNSFVGLILLNNKINSPELTKLISDKLKAFVDYVNLFDEGFKVKLGYEGTTISGKNITIGYKDIEGFVMANIKQKPEVAYNFMFQVLTKKADMAVYLKNTYQKGDVNLLSGILKDFKKNITNDKLMKSNFRRLITVTEPGLDKILAKYPSIIKKIDDMVENGSSTQTVNELFKEVYNKEFFDVVSTLTTYLYKINELTKTFGTIISPLKEDKLIEKTSMITDLLDKMRILSTDVSKLDSNKLEEGLSIDIDNRLNVIANDLITTTNTRVITSPMGQPTFDKQVKLEMDGGSGALKDKFNNDIKKYGMPVSIDAGNIINVANNKVSQAMETFRAFLSKKLNGKAKSVAFNHALIGEDTITTRKSLGGETYMPLDIYVSNKLIAEIMNINGIYTSKNILELNSLLEEKYQNLLLNTIKSDYEMSTRKWISKYLIDKELASDVNPADIPEEVSTMLYKYILDTKILGNEGELKSRLGILKSIEDSVLKESVDMSTIAKKEGTITNTIRDSLGLDDGGSVFSFRNTEGFDESYVQEMIDAMYDDMFRSYQMDFNTDILGAETKVYKSMTYNYLTYMSQIKSNATKPGKKISMDKGVLSDISKTNISVQSKIRELGIRDAIKQGYIDRVKIYVGKTFIAIGNKDIGREDIYYKLLDNFKESRKIHIEYELVDKKIVSEIIGYDGMWRTGLGKYMLEDLGLDRTVKGLDGKARVITLEEIYDAMRKKLYTKEGLNMKPSKDGKIYKLSYQDSSILRKLEHNTTGKLFNDGGFDKVMSTGIDGISTSQLGHLDINLHPINAKALRIEGVVPKFDIVKEEFDLSDEALNITKENGKKNLEYEGEIMGNEMVTYQDEIYDSISKDLYNEVEQNLKQNRDSSKYIVQVVDQSTGEHYIGTLEKTSKGNEFTPYDVVDVSNPIKITKEKSLIDDIKIREGIDMLDKNLSC